MSFPSIRRRDVLLGLPLGSFPDHNQTRLEEIQLRTLGGAEGEVPYRDSPRLVTPEMWGAKGDGVTDDSAAMQAAYDFAFKKGAGVVFGPFDYRLSSTILPPSNVSAYGCGKDRTRLLCNGSPGIAYRGVNHATLADLTIRGDNKTAGIVELSAMSANSISNTFSNIRFIGNAGGPRPNFGRTSHVGVRGLEAADGLGNYFHRFIGCDFDNLFAAFHADYNANAWQVIGGKAQSVWRMIRGGMQQWMVDGLFWHSSPGDEPHEAVAIELFGKSREHKALYNRFINIVAEPGSKLTRLISLDANTLANYIDGDHQCTLLGEDQGAHNVLRQVGIGRYEIADERRLRFKQMYISDNPSNTARTVDIFGDGSIAHSGSDVGHVRIFGAFGESNHLDLYTRPGANGTIATHARKLKLAGATGLNIQNLPISSIGLKTGDVWNDGGTLKIV